MDGDACDVGGTSVALCIVCYQVLFAMFAFVRLRLVVFVCHMFGGCVTAPIDVVLVFANFVSTNTKCINQASPVTPDDTTSEEYDVFVQIDKKQRTG